MKNIKEIGPEEHRQREAQAKEYFAEFFHGLAGRVSDTVKKPSLAVVLVQFTDGSVAQFRRGLIRANPLEMVGALEIVKMEFISQIPSQDIST
jgi:hypothetical protein